MYSFFLVTTTRVVPLPRPWFWGVTIVPPPYLNILPLIIFLLKNIAGHLWPRDVQNKVALLSQFRPVAVLPFCNIDIRCNITFPLKLMSCKLYFFLRFPTKIFTYYNVSLTCPYPACSVATARLYGAVLWHRWYFVWENQIWALWTGIVYFRWGFCGNVCDCLNGHSLSLNKLNLLPAEWLKNCLRNWR